MPCARVLLSIVILFVLLSLPTLQQAQDDSSRHSYRFTADQIVVGKVSGFDVIYYGDLEPSRLVGSPQLPVQLVHVPLPAGKKISSVEIVAVESEELPGRYHLLPAQPPQILSGPAHQFVSPNPHVYSSVQAFPADIAVVARQGFFSGYNVGSVLIHPLQYVPSQQKLILHSRIELRIHYQASGKLPLPFKSTSYSETIRKEAAGTYFDGPLPRTALLPQYAPGATALPDEEHAYVIITSDGLVEQFQTLADWKSKRGLSAKIVTTSWIYAAYLGADEAEQIRNFIKDAYQNWGTLWVLLGGDVNIVPVRKAWAMDCEAGAFNYNYIPCDLYYSDLDGDWNANGNDVYGEVDDDVDMYADVFVGRATVENPGEANTFVGKVIDYESYVPDNLTDMLFLAEVLWDNPYTNSGLGKDLIDSLYVPARFDPINKLYEALGNENYASVMAALNAGQHIINHNGHAYIEVMGIGDGYLIESDVDQLTNATRQSIVYSIGCWPAAFDDDCIAEHFINNMNGGAVAFIGNSRYGWGSPGNPLYGYSDRFDQQFFKYLFREDVYHIGQALSSAKAVFVPFSQQENVYRWCEYEINLLGDPEMSVWTDAHGYLAVDHPAEVPVGDNRHTITVSKGGSPIAGALVCLMQDSSVYESGFTSLEGQATFDFTASNPSEPIHITVTAHNLFSYESTITVVSSDPYVRIASYGSDETDNKYVTPGARVFLGAYFKNYGNEPADSVSVALTCGSGHITLLDGAEYLGDISPGDSVRVLCAFSLDAHSDLANGEVVYLSCDIVDGNGHSWADKISLTGATPLLAFADHQMDDAAYGDGDGIVEPGELVRMDMLVKNSGLAGAEYVEAELSSDHPQVYLVDTAVIYWNIPPSGSGQVPAKLQIDPSCPVPSFPQIDVVYRTREGLEFADSFTIAVGATGFSDDMESGEGGWSHSGLYDFWHLSDYRKQSGDYSWYSGADVLHSYMPGMLAILESPPFVIENNSHLSFMCWYRFPNYGTDGFYVEVNDGSEWTTLDFIGSGGALGALSTGNDWLEYSYDLSHYAQGTTMMLRFRFVSDIED
ncbi:MAG: C25 family cysteine peptidase, partial [Candidatus Latescibacterota bacterium]